MIRHKGVAFGNGCVHGTLVEASILERQPSATDRAAQIIVAFERIPSVKSFAANAKTPGVVGILLPEISGYSHLAWAVGFLGVPTICLDTSLLPKTHANVFVNLEDGTVSIAESDQELRALKENEAVGQVKWEQIRERARPAAKTSTGVLVDLLAEIQSPNDIAFALTSGADGVGVIKTELMFDSEGTGTLSALQIVKAIKANTCWGPIPIRFFDFTPDKTFGDMSELCPMNSLGYRGIRLLEVDNSLADRFLMAVDGIEMNDVIVILPMVCLPNEVARFREIIGKAVPNVGVTVETPAAALMVRELAQVSDYIEIGINDLTQYTMAWDRNTPNSERLPHGQLVEPVARLVAHVLGEAAKAGTPSCLGIDLPPNQRLAAQLVQIGARALSVSPALIPRWKEAIRSVI